MKAIAPKKPNAWMNSSKRSGKKELRMLNFFRKLKEKWEVEQACRQTIEIYKTGTAEERQQIEDLLWEVGMEKNDMAQAEAVVNSLRQIL